VTIRSGAAAELSVSVVCVFDRVKVRPAFLASLPFPQLYGKLPL
jgi:hypothetical protein